MNYTSTDTRIALTPSFQRYFALNGTDGSGDKVAGLLPNPKPASGADQARP